MIASGRVCGNAAHWIRRIGRGACALLINPLRSDHQGSAKANGLFVLQRSNPLDVNLEARQLHWRAFLFSYLSMPKRIAADWRIKGRPAYAGLG
jgi:hypothetical protein